MKTITAKMEKKVGPLSLYNTYPSEGKGEVEVGELQHTRVPVTEATHAHAARVSFHYPNFLQQTYFYNNDDKLLATFR
jgi:hypothetical protein